VATAETYDATGNAQGTVDLPEPLFGAQVHEHLLHESVKRYLANQRQGTSKVKSRNEVTGGGRKPWKQKGSGRARAGSNTSPIWVGGGRAFGPRPRDYRIELPKKQRRAALISALSLCASEGKIRVISDPEFDEPKTKQMVELLASLGVEEGRVLMVLGEPNENLLKSCRNMRRVRTTLAVQVTPYYLLEAKHVVITTSALERMKEVFGP
jgi:large subunit ribosomal protein L4